MLGRRRQFSLAIILSWIILGTSFLFLIYERDYALLENSLEKSVRASAEQLADGIALSVKIQDLPNTHRQVANSYIARTSSSVVIKDIRGGTFLDVGLKDSEHIHSCRGREMTVPIRYNQENVGEIQFCTQLKSDESVLFRKSTVIATVMFVVLIGGVLFLFFRLSTADIRELLSRIGTIDPRNPRIDLPENLSQQDQAVAEVYQKLSLLLAELIRVGEENRESQQLAAIARLTQMLAHDVRRPFSMLKMLLDGISKAKTPVQIQAFASAGIPETIRAMNSVNGLIQDVMEIGSNSEVFPAAVKPESILEAALGEVFQTLSETRVTFSYALSHTMNVNVEASKILRVFSNILANAVQAMNQAGTIRISTDDVVEGQNAYVKFVLGNDGPPIPAENLPKLFEAFFTSGKKGGTGLGLAIAHKIVTAHKGRIQCESSPEIGVEFHILLPAIGPALYPDSSNLPRTGEEIAAKFRTLGGSTQGDEAEVRLEISLKNLLPSLGRRMSILIVDDEGIYRNSLAESLTRDTDLAALLEISRADRSETALAVRGADLAIVDVDLGEGSLSGFDLVREMRNRGDSAFICIHSNRISASDNKTAISRGADAFLPKPMSRAHLLKLLFQSLEKLGLVDPTMSSPEVSDGPDQFKSPMEIANEIAHEPVFALVDDMKTVRMSWAADWPIGELATFSSPEKFWSHVEQNPDFMKTLTCLVTDLNFGGLSAIDGAEFVKQVRARSAVPILVASNSETRLEDFSGMVDGVLGKEPPSREALVGFIKKCR